MKEKSTKYQIVAICTHCGKEVTRSKVFNSRKELTKAWDVATLVAPQVLPKCSCGQQSLNHGFNFDMGMKVAVIKENSEELVEPKLVLRKSKNAIKV